MATGQPGRPTTSYGWTVADGYFADPDNVALPNWINYEDDNTGKAFFLAKLRDLQDIIDSSSLFAKEFSQYITADYTVPSGRDAVTYSRGIADGVTVTVSDGSILYWNSCYTP